MSEEQAGGSAGDGVTAGMLLRRAREAAGLHIATLAVSLKVPVRKLEALEEDRYDELSDAVFVRALASSVCRTLKVDPQPVLERLPQGAKPRLVRVADGINEPFRGPGDVPAQGWADQLSRPVTLAVLALLLGALVIILMPTMRFDSGATVVRSNLPAPLAESSASAPAVAASDGALPPLAQAAAAAASAAIAASAASAASEPLVASAASAASAAPPGAATAPPVTSGASSPAAPASASAPASAADAGGIIVFRAKAASWVQVTDARGNTALRKLLEPGETASAGGALPLSVTVGSAPATEVLVRGKPFDLTAATRDNVARFEVR